MCSALATHRLPRGEAREDAKSEGERLSGARGGPSADVTPSQAIGQGGGLDREGGGDTSRFQRRRQRGRNTEVHETHGREGRGGGRHETPIGRNGVADSMIGVSVGPVGVRRLLRDEPAVHRTA